MRASRLLPLTSAFLFDLKIFLSNFFFHNATNKQTSQFIVITPPGPLFCLQRPSCLGVPRSKKLLLNGGIPPRQGYMPFAVDLTQALMWRDRREAYLTLHKIQGSCWWFNRTSKMAIEKDWRCADCQFRSSGVQFQSLWKSQYVSAILKFCRRLCSLKDDEHFGSHSP